MARGPRASLQRKPRGVRGSQLVLKLLPRGMRGSRRSLSRHADSAGTCLREASFKIHVNVGSSLNFPSAQAGHLSNADILLFLMFYHSISLNVNRENQTPCLVIHTNQVLMEEEFNSSFPVSVGRTGLWAQYSPLPIFINKVLLEHSHSHSLPYCLRQLHVAMVELSCCSRSRIAHKT